VLLHFTQNGGEWESYLPVSAEEFTGLPDTQLNFVVPACKGRERKQRGGEGNIRRLVEKVGEAGSCSLPTLRHILQICDKILTDSCKFSTGGGRLQRQILHFWTKIFREQEDFRTNL